jgi:hypothetical protein
MSVGSSHDADLTTLLDEYNLSREELESLAESEYPAAPVAKSLLDQL